LPLQPPLLQRHFRRSLPFLHVLLPPPLLLPLFQPPPLLLLLPPPLLLLQLLLQSQICVRVLQSP
jgi:hypothetical protein